MVNENKIIKGDCLLVLDKIINDKSVDVILTSPFYNTSRKSNSERSLRENEARYDIHIDNLTDDEYLEFTLRLFDKYDSVLKDDGVVLYNMSYSSENTTLMWLTISTLISKSNFTVVDNIIWKKSTALPNNTSSNKLTRICEYVFVFCKKGMEKKFKMNKSIKSTNNKGQKYYENIYNFIEAKNNDGSCKLNKATYSTELCDKLLSMYAQPNSLILDSFNGTGTTGVSAIKNGHSYIGIELSEEQCKYSVERIKKETGIDIKGYSMK